MSMETHVIHEIHPGVFYTLLDFPKPSIVIDLLSDDYPWVMRWGNHVGDSTWQEYNLPIKGLNDSRDVFTRGVEYDYVVETSKFLEMYSDRSSVELAQLRKFPQDYLNLKNINGKERYRLLAEVDWYFTCDIPGARDYAPIESPDRNLIEKAIKLTEADT